MTSYEFFIAVLHHYSCFSWMTLPYFMYFNNCALELCKIRIKLFRLTFKGKQNMFPHHQPLHCLILTIQSNYEAYCHSFSTSAIDLHVDAARIFGCCTSSLVIPVVPVDLNILWEAVNVSKKFHAKVLDNHWYLSISTLPDVFNRLKDAVALLITHSIIHSLIIVFSQNSLFHSHT